MAAAISSPGGFEVVDLRHFRGSHLAQILREQEAAWKRRFLWDYSASREILQRYLDLRNLNGCALVYAGQPAGYSYFVHENRKALVGDLFIADAFRSEEGERLLLRSTLRAAVLYPGVRRIEGQLLALTIDPSQEVIFGRELTVFPRHFLFKEDLRAAAGVAAPPRTRFVLWSEQHLDAAADLITRAYADHVDSRINDQYRSFGGARKFLQNTTQHPGCGVFYRDAAVLAADAETRQLCGLCLGSVVHPGVGHITQLCVAPGARRRRLGAALLSRTMEAFRRHGCHSVSLTVTASNRSAVSLYEGAGLQTLHTFPAFVWEAHS